MLPGLRRFVSSGMDQPVVRLANLFGTTSKSRGGRWIRLAAKAETGPRTGGPLLATCQQRVSSGNFTETSRTSYGVDLSSSPFRTFAAASSRDAPSILDPWCGSRIGRTVCGKDGLGDGCAAAAAATRRRSLLGSPLPAVGGVLCSAQQQQQQQQRRFINSGRSRRGLYNGKDIRTGNNVSFSNKRTKRKFKPNVFKKRVYSEVLDEMIRFHLTTSTLRSIDKAGGLDQYLLTSKYVTEGEGMKVKRRVLKRLKLLRKTEEKAANAAAEAESVSA